ncbi:hypothetical protein, partial [Corynebacterium diphtheriae]|uniref:hypothetical protein n=3 Tax=Corynebacterium diphtheriae TaxID=1717 RepID=UPI00202BB994
RDHGYVLKDSRHENTSTTHPCYRITAPVNKRGRPVRGSINSSFDYSGPVLGVDRRYWFWNGAGIVFCVYAKILFFVLNGISNVPFTTIFGAAFLVF